MIIIIVKDVKKTSSSLDSEASLARPSRHSPSTFTIYGDHHNDDEDDDGDGDDDDDDDDDDGDDGDGDLDTYLDQHFHLENDDDDDDDGDDGDGNYVDFDVDDDDDDDYDNGDDDGDGDLDTYLNQHFNRSKEEKEEIYFKSGLEIQRQWAGLGFVTWETSKLLIFVANV